MNRPTLQTEKAVDRACKGMVVVNSVCRLVMISMIFCSHPHYVLFSTPFNSSGSHVDIATSLAIEKA